MHIIPRRTACHAFPAKDAVRSAFVLLGGLIGEIDRSREMGATRATQAAPQQVGERLANLAGTAAERWRAQLGHYLALIERIPVLLCRGPGEIGQPFAGLLRCRVAGADGAHFAGTIYLIYQPAEKNESGANGVLRWESVTCGSARNYVRSRLLLDARQEGGRFSRFPFLASILGYYSA